MGRGAAEVVKRLHDEGRLDGVLSVGGSGNSSIAAQAMRALPVGVPKLMVSTVASGDTRPYVGAVDVTMMYSVVDIAGVNRISARILANAAGAIAGMAKASVDDQPPRRGSPADRRDDVRRHDAVRDPGARAARGARLRGARLPRHGHRRPVDGGARPRPASSPACSTRRRRSWPTSSSAACSPPGRTASRRPGARAAAGRLARRARHGQLRPARDGAREVRGPEPLRPQPDDHADADDARRVPRARPPDRAQALRREGADRALRAAEGRLDDRGRGRAVPRSRRPTPRCSRASTRRSARTSRCTSSTRTSTTRRSPTRWPTGSTS